MRFRKSSLDAIVARLRQLGLTHCPVCGGESLYNDLRPAVLPVGGSPWMDEGDPRRGSPDVNVLFLIVVKCRLCGYVLLFDSEEFEDGDTKTLVAGLTIEEEGELERLGELEAARSPLAPEDEPPVADAPSPSSGSL